MSSLSPPPRSRCGGRRHHLQFPPRVVPRGGGGCRVRCRPRILSQLPSFLHPSPKPSASSSTAQHMRCSSRSSSGFFPSSASTTSSSATTFTTTHSSSSYSCSSSAGHHNLPSSNKTHGKKKQQRYQKIGVARAAAGKEEEEREDDVGVAVEKESSDPRADFCDSMVQMVVETGLCGWDNLRCMLRRLLSLNAPHHHAAFTEVCAHLTVPPPPPSPPPYDYHYHY